MSEKIENIPDKPKRRCTFWYIVGAAIILTIVYQSGRSSGIHSMSETVERSAAAPPVVAPPVVASQERVAPQPPLNIPFPAPQRESQPPRSELVATRTVNSSGDAQQQRVARPTNIPEHLTAPASLPPRTSESGPPPGLVPSVIGTIDPTQVPLPAPVDSVYDRRSPEAVTQTGLSIARQPSSGSARPSETGLIPLRPLAPIPAGYL